MGTIVAIACFTVIVGIGALLQRHDASGTALELHDQPKRTPLPGARDSYAVTGMLGHAAVPSWG